MVVEWWLTRESDSEKDCVRESDRRPTDYSVGCVYSLFDIFIVDIYLDYGYMHNPRQNILNEVCRFIQ
jgi:hypothetical protein